MTYEEIQARLALDYGWTYEAIDGMTFDQIGNALAQGKRRRGRAVSGGADPQAGRRAMLRWLGGR